jgi:hypothetical protein
LVTNIKTSYALGITVAPELILLEFAVAGANRVSFGVSVIAAFVLLLLAFSVATGIDGLTNVVVQGVTNEGSGRAALRAPLVLRDAVPRDLVVRAGFACQSHARVITRRAVAAPITSFVPDVHLTVSTTRCRFALLRAGGGPTG